MSLAGITPLPGQVAALPGEPVVGLEQRVAGPFPLPDNPELDSFYEALVNRGEPWHDQVFRFLSAYRNEQGEQPYRTNGAQMEVLQAVLARMKREGLQDSDLYKQTYKAFATVFGVKSFIAQFSAEVFDTEAVGRQDEENEW